MKNRKIMLAACLLAAGLAMNVFAADEPETAEEPTAILVGGWEMAEDTVVTEDIMDVFDKAMEDYEGAEFVPEALLATQLVSGTNYCLLTKMTPVVPDAQPTYALLYIYEDLSGNASIMDVQELKIGIGD